MKESEGVFQEKKRQEAAFKNMCHFVPSSECAGACVKHPLGRDFALLIDIPHGWFSELAALWEMCHLGTCRS